MKKLSIIFISLFIAMGAVSLSAQDKKGSTKETFAKQVEKQPNGDVIISGIKSPESIKDIVDIGICFTAYLSYIEEDLDYENLGKAINKAVGKKKAANGGRPISAIMDGINKYLARKNMNLQPIKFGGTSAQQKISDGLPIFCWVKSSSVYAGELKNRSEKRAQASDIKAWAKELRKHELKKIDYAKNTCSQALVVGFNKTSGEFCLLGLAPTSIWLTEKELKSMIDSAHVLRF